MLRPTLVLAALGALSLAGCDDYRQEPRDDYDAAQPVEVAPPVE